MFKVQHLLLSRTFFLFICATKIMTNNACMESVKFILLFSGKISYVFLSVLFIKFKLLSWKRLCRDKVVKSNFIRLYKGFFVFDVLPKV